MVVTGPGLVVGPGLVEGPRLVTGWGPGYISTCHQSHTLCLPGALLTYLLTYLISSSFLTVHISSISLPEGTARHLHE